MDKPIFSVVWAWSENGATGVPPGAVGIAPSIPGGLVWPAPEIHIETTSPMCAGFDWLLSRHDRR
jgi:hypothetical protein